MAAVCMCQYLCIQYVWIYTCIYVQYVSMYPVSMYLSIMFTFPLSVYLKCYRNAACSRWRWERQQNLLFHKLTHLSSSFFHLVFILSFTTCRDGRPWAMIMLNIVVSRSPGKTHPPANNAAEVKHSAAWMEKHSSCTADLAWHTCGSADRKHADFSYFGGGLHQGNWWKVERLFGLGVTCGAMNECSSLHIWWMFAFEPGFPNCAEWNRHGPVWIASVRIWSGQLERGNVWLCQKLPIESITLLPPGWGNNLIGPFEMWHTGYLSNHLPSSFSASMDCFPRGCVK